MRQVIVEMHLLTYFQLIFVGFVALVWGIRCWRRESYSDGFRMSLHFLAWTGVAQAALGSILFLSGCRPENILHLVYGLIAVAGVPVGYAYINEKIGKRDLLILTIVAFAIVAAAFRAYATGIGGFCPS